MNFEQAWEHLKAGEKVSRAAWNSAGLYLELQRPDSNSKVSHSDIYINYPMDSKIMPGEKVKWLRSYTHFLVASYYHFPADDWEVK